MVGSQVRRYAASEGRRAHLNAKVWLDSGCCCGVLLACACLLVFVGGFFVVALVIEPAGGCQVKEMGEAVLTRKLTWMLPTVRGQGKSTAQCCR